MAEEVEMVHTHLIFDQMAAPVPEIMDGSLSMWHIFETFKVTNQDTHVTICQDLREKLNRPTIPLDCFLFTKSKLAPNGIRFRDITVQKQSQADEFKPQDILFFLTTVQQNISFFPFQPFPLYALNEIQPQTETASVNEQLNYC
jgi:hypothetical protein